VGGAAGFGGVCAPAGETTNHEAATIAANVFFASRMKDSPVVKAIGPKEDTQGMPLRIVLVYGSEPHTCNRGFPREAS